MGSDVSYGALHLVSMLPLLLWCRRPYKHCNPLMISLGLSVVWYMLVPTPPPVTLRYANGSDRFDSLMTTAFEFSLESWTPFFEIVLHQCVRLSRRGCLWIDLLVGSWILPCCAWCWVSEHTDRDIIYHSSMSFIDWLNTNALCSDFQQGLLRVCSDSFHSVSDTTMAGHQTWISPSRR